MTEKGSGPEETGGAEGTPAEGSSRAVGPYNVLFLCTGNTCRSPLAEALARREARERGWKPIAFRSAGTAAGRGAPASVGSRRVADRHGVDLSEHAAAPLDDADVEWADLILCMTERHVAAAREMGAGEKARAITDFVGDERSGGVSDPVGGGDEAYASTYRQLEWLVSRVLDRLEPVVAP